MLRLLKIGLLLTTCLNLVNCNGQTHNKETNTLSDDFNKSMPFYYKMPQNLSSSDTSPAFAKARQKILLTGTVYQRDGKTPAPNVILYYYQTNTDGIYATKETEERNMPKNKLGQTHGYIRGWLKTDEQGKYSLYTVKPGAYPNRDDAAHVHITVKEKNMKDPYYIDNFVFDNDPLLTTKHRKKMENRGGSGVVRFVQKRDLYIGERNIVLGLNIPDYTVQDFVGNKPNWDEVKDWLMFLDIESQKRENYLKVFFVYGNESNYTKDKRIQELEKLGTELDLQKVALTFVPSFKDKSSEINLNKIDPNVKNTFLIYKRSNIIDKYVDLEPNQENFKKIINRLDETTNQYFKLLRSKQ